MLRRLEGLRELQWGTPPGTPPARGAHLLELLGRLLVDGDVDDDGEDLHPVQGVHAVHPDIQEGVDVLGGREESDLPPGRRERGSRVTPRGPGELRPRETRESAQRPCAQLSAARLQRSHRLEGAP